MKPNESESEPTDHEVIVAILALTPWSLTPQHAAKAILTQLEVRGWTPPAPAAPTPEIQP